MKKEEDTKQKEALPEEKRHNIKKKNTNTSDIWWLR